MLPRKPNLTNLNDDMKNVSKSYC